MKIEIEKRLREIKKEHIPGIASFACDESSGTRFLSEQKMDKINILTDTAPPSTQNMVLRGIYLPLKYWNLFLLSVNTLESFPTLSSAKLCESFKVNFCIPDLSILLQIIG